jgi:hypothetical protein
MAAPLPQHRNRANVLNIAEDALERFNRTGSAGLLVVTELRLRRPQYSTLS